MAGSDNKRLLSALEANWQAEMAGFHTYSALAKGEADPHRRNALRGLATAEKHHAELWADRIKAAGGSEPQHTENVWSAARLQGLVRSRRQVCGNVFGL